MIKGINMAIGDKQQEVMVPINELVRPTALDYDVSTQYIYYSDIQRFVVERQKVDGSSREVVIESGNHSLIIYRDVMKFCENLIKYFLFCAKD